MKNLTSIILTLAFLACASFSVSYAKDKSWTGYLSDVGCGSGFAKKSAKVGLKDAMDHPKSCAMKASCASAGYGIYCKGKYYSFDKNGNDKASAYLAKTNKEKGLLVEVTGSMKGNTIDVTDLKDAPGKAK
ncbi:MAG TPA: hypothetical protein VFA55_07385 [Candidatus Kapabacteria bacterium]|nr:hypothetical protein [Candidatus Kapabacteria bacterium]